MLSDYLKDPHNNYIQALLLLQCTRVHWHAAPNKLRMTNTSGQQHIDLTTGFGNKRSSSQTALYNISERCIGGDFLGWFAAILQVWDCFGLTAFCCVGEHCCILRDRSDDKRRLPQHAAATHSTCQLLKWCTIKVQWLLPHPRTINLPNRSMKCQNRLPN